MIIYFACNKFTYIILYENVDREYRRQGLVQRFCILVSVFFYHYYYYFRLQLSINNCIQVLYYFQCFLEYSDLSSSKMKKCDREND